MVKHKPHPPHQLITFGSFVHGSGRSSVSKALFSELDDGNTVFVSSGDYFREMAEKRGMNIEEFINYLHSHPKVMKKVEEEIDEKMMNDIEKYLKQGKRVIVDSNLHSHPDIYNATSVHFYVYTHPEILGKRLKGVKRKGGEVYKDEKEAVRKLIERTVKDAVRYKFLEKHTKKERLKHLYSKGSDTMLKLVRLYRLYGHDKEKIRRHFVRVLHGKGVFLDNSGPLEDTIHWVKTILGIR